MRSKSETNGERAAYKLFVSNLYLGVDDDMTELEQEAIQTGLRVLTSVSYLVGLNKNTVTDNQCFPLPFFTKCICFYFFLVLQHFHQP